jgi:hypothetical protein
MKRINFSGALAALLAISMVTAAAAKETPPAPGPLKKLAFRPTAR